jgi:hypothetical protein
MHLHVKLTVEDIIIVRPLVSCGWYPRKIEQPCTTSLRTLSLESLFVYLDNVNLQLKLNPMPIRTDSSHPLVASEQSMPYRRSTLHRETGINNSIVDEFSDSRLSPYRAQLSQQFHQRYHEVMRTLQLHAFAVTSPRPPPESYLSPPPLRFALQNSSTNEASTGLAVDGNNDYDEPSPNDTNVVPKRHLQTPELTPYRAELSRKFKTIYEEVMTGSGLSDTKEEFECSVCMECPSRDDIAIINGCTHRFCVACIERWSKRNNSCPLCKAEFQLITSGGSGEVEVRPATTSTNSLQEELDILQRLGDSNQRLRQLHSNMQARLRITTQQLHGEVELTRPAINTEQMQTMVERFRSFNQRFPERRVWSFGRRTYQVIEEPDIEHSVARWLAVSRGIQGREELW